MRFFPGGVAVLTVAVALLTACGARDSIAPTVDGRVEQPPDPRVERCNGRDDDLDGEVDEPFRDALGHYVDDAHCGACGRPCLASFPALELACELLDGAPLCGAVRCAEGYVRSLGGYCVPAFRTLCLPCVDDDDCGDVVGARCVERGGEARCAEPCVEGACPGGYTCDPARSLCVPTGGSCTCEAGRDFDLACALTDPTGRVCAGDATCRDGVLSACVPPDEACNGLDDDCDGQVDEPYRNALGAYAVDIHHCGACGVDCTADVAPGALVCGGDAFSPSCVLDCVDARDGVQVGDRIDADRDIATGCECRVGALGDVAGPVGAVGEQLDVNCDGADGVVLESFYVAPDGDDAAIGSPTRPLRTLDVALRRAKASLADARPRPHVFVAAGSYAETAVVPVGVRLYGGYRRDFLALDPSGFVTEVRAQTSDEGQGRPALVVVGPVDLETRVAWIRFLGADATLASRAAMAAYFDAVGPLLTLTGCELRAGAPTAGSSGPRGVAGDSEAVAAVPGQAPRGAVESATHVCIAGASNRGVGGAGGQNVCGARNVSGGAGGTSVCPVSTARAVDGQSGTGYAGTPAGSGGRGGQDSFAPISGTACPDQPVCCGLADFSVSTDFVTPGPGDNGSSGTSGVAGRGCVAPYGAFAATVWLPSEATAGTAGAPGSGGGGGGAGGGVEFDWFGGLCEFVDGLGGGGGGGGAGGCGGGAGAPGTSGGPSIALLVVATDPTRLPVLEDNRFLTFDGGRGGDGGAGGEGGSGGVGAVGTEIPRALRTTPTLAGPFAGGRGGRGGDGGSGGGGGGGCGGASVGVWVTGLGASEPASAAAYRTGNRFTLGRGGAAGRGGGATGSAGLEGGMHDVLVR